MLSAQSGLLVVVTRIDEISGQLDHQLYGYVDVRDAHEGWRLHETLKGPLLLEHLHAWNATAEAWQGIGHAAGGKLMVDASE